MITKLSENAIQSLLEKKEETSIVQLLQEPKPVRNQESLMQIEISDGYFFYKKVFIIGKAIPKHNKLKKFMVLKVNLNKQQQKQDMIIIDDFSIIYQNLDKLIGAPINYKYFQEGVKNPKGSREIPLQYLNNDNLKTDQVKLLNPRTLFSESDSSQEKQDQLKNNLVKQQNDIHENENGVQLQNKISQQKSQDSQSKFNYLGDDQDYLYSFDAFINKAKYFKQSNQITYNKSGLSSTLQMNNNKSLEKESTLIKNQGLSYLQKKNIESSDKVETSQKKAENTQLNTSNNKSKQVIVQNNNDQILKSIGSTQQNNNLISSKEQNNICEKPIQKQQDIHSKIQPVSKEISNVIQKNQVEVYNDSQLNPNKDKVINQQQNQQQQNTNELQSETPKQNITAFNSLKLKLQQLQQKKQINKEDIPIESYLSSSQNQKSKDDQYFCMSSTQNLQSAQILKDQIQLSGDKYNRVEQKSEQIRQLFINKTSNKLLQKFKSPSPQKNGQGCENQQNCYAGQFDVKKSIPIKKSQKSSSIEISSNMVVESANKDEIISNTKNTNIKDVIQFSQSQTNQKSINNINNDKKQILPNSLQIPNDIKKSEQEILKIPNVTNNQSKQLAKETNDQQLKQSVEKQQTVDNQEINTINHFSNLQIQNNNELQSLQKSAFIPFSPIQMKKPQNNLMINDSDFLFSQSEDSQSQDFTGFVKASDLKYSVDNQQITDSNKSQQLQKIAKQQHSPELKKNNSHKKEDQSSQKSKKANKILEKEQNNIEREWKYLVQAIEDDSQSEDEITKQYQDNQPLKQKQNIENTPSKNYEESSTNIVTSNIIKKYLQEEEDNIEQNLQSNTEQKQNILNEGKQDINQQEKPMQDGTSQLNNNQCKNDQILFDIPQHLKSQETKMEIQSQQKKQNTQNPDNRLEDEEISQYQQQNEIQQLNVLSEKSDEISLNKAEKIENTTQNQNKYSISNNELSLMLIESEQITCIQDQNKENIEKQQLNNNFQNIQTQENEKQIILIDQPQDLDNNQTSFKEQLNIYDIEQQQNHKIIEIQSQKSIQIEQSPAKNQKNDESMDLEVVEQFDFNIDIENSEKEPKNFLKAQEQQAPMEQNKNSGINNQIQQNTSTIKKQNSEKDLMENEDELKLKDKEKPKIIELKDSRNESQQAEKIKLPIDEISITKDQDQPAILEQIIQKNEDQKLEKISPKQNSKKNQIQNNLFAKSDEKEKQKTLLDFNFKKDQQISQQLPNIDQNQKQSIQITNQKQTPISKQTIIKKQFKIPSQSKPEKSISQLNQSSQQNQFLEDSPQKNQKVQNESSKSVQKGDNVKSSTQKPPVMIEISDDEEIFQFTNKNKSKEPNINHRNKQINCEQNKQSETNSDKKSIDKSKQSIQKQSSFQSSESLDKKSQSNSQSDSQIRKRRRLLKSDFEDIILKQLHKEQSNEMILECPSFDSSSKIQSQILHTSQSQQQNSFMKQFEYKHKDKNSQNLQNKKSINNQQTEKNKIEKQDKNEDWECYSDISLNEDFIEIIDD
ncbi:hypothetical protein ABPG74_017068 [Tetrahymena malaccensis]